ncbi:MAG: urease accessory protein UreD [Pseudomonadota bacterium]|nr:urease accessory protein UreD [Pseudomonadota bacterium]
MLTTPSESLTKGPARSIIKGKAILCVTQNSDKITRIKDLYQTDPLRVLFPQIPEGEIHQSVIVTTSGGLVGGDKITIDIKSGAHTKSLIMAQAAEKIYRSTGKDTEIKIDLNCEEGSWLEFLPQETILFDGSRLQRKTNINVYSNARVLTGEIVVFGRSAYGEEFKTGMFKDSWEVAYNDRFVWSDSFLLGENIASIVNNWACLDDAVALGTLVYMGPDTSNALSIARESIKIERVGVIAGVTCVNGVLITRFVGRDALNLRKTFEDLWKTLRNNLVNLPQKMPRLWSM